VGSPLHEQLHLQNTSIIQGIIKNKTIPNISPFHRGGESDGEEGRENTTKEEESDPNTPSKLRKEQGRGHLVETRGSPGTATIGGR
jgi:hypothetical protein